MKVGEGELTTVLRRRHSRFPNGLQLLIDHRWRLNRLSTLGEQLRNQKHSKETIAYLLSSRLALGRILRNVDFWSRLLSGSFSFRVKGPLVEVQRVKVGQLRRYEVGVSTSDSRKRREHASKINPRELRINPQLQQVAS